MRDDRHYRASRRRRSRAWIQRTQRRTGDRLPGADGAARRRATRAAVAIVGGGFTGAAVAFHLAQTGAEADILVFEPRGRLGGGLAYGGDDPAHRVNVPASRMSLLPDDEGHFARWLAETDALGDDPQAVVGGEAYPRRGEFGRYVDAQLQPLLKSGAVRHIRASVVAMRKVGGLLAHPDRAGETFRARLAVIATTHPKAGLPPELAPLLRRRWPDRSTPSPRARWRRSAATSAC